MTNSRKTRKRRVFGRIRAKVDGRVWILELHRMYLRGRPLYARKWASLSTFSLVSELIGQKLFNFNEHNHER